MKIAIAMSGGIDSSIAAVILKEQGHDIIGITARFLPPSPINDHIYKTSLNDARQIAALYNFPHYEFNFSESFKKCVIDYFCEEYKSGKTPNPCVVCNRYVKFSGLIQIADELGCEMIATGHYALKKTGNGRIYVSMSPDQTKDQSYFLFMLTQEQLARSLFPLGNKTKNDIKLFASEINLPMKDKPESQEICFIPDNDYISYIEKNVFDTPPAGDIIDSEGRILGRHNGIYRYTIGQRKGMGISAPQPLYVTSIDPVRNTITAGTRDNLYIRYIETKNTYDMKYKIKTDEKVRIKSRSTQTPVDGIVTRIGDRFIVVFDEPQTGISPGQCAVFYDKENDIAGGGIIDKAYN